jgi:endoglucanase
LNTTFFTSPIKLISLLLVLFLFIINCKSEQEKSKDAVIPELLPQVVNNTFVENATNTDLLPINPQVLATSSEKTSSSTPLNTKTYTTLPVNKQNYVNNSDSVKTIASVSNLEWGAFAGQEASDLTEFESLVGKPVDIAAIFINWESDFPYEFAANLASTDKTLLIFWEQDGFPLTQIINGNSDAYIEKFATAVSNYRGRVIIAPLHEMNGDWVTWGGTVGSNTPIKVVRTWQHIVKIFGDVPNAKFAWTVNNVSEPDTPINSISNYYPGDEYVDYVAVDGFNFGSPWQSFAEVFDESLAQLRTFHKPIYILSTATAEDSRKSDWITDTFTTQLPKHPEVVGLVWFNENKEKDWRVNSNNAALSAFQTALP